MSRARSLPLNLACVAVAALLLATSASASDGRNETPIVVRVDQGGFHWSDAAIGALAGVGISLTATGFVALVRLRGAGVTSRTKGEQP